MTYAFGILQAPQIATFFVPLRTLMILKCWGDLFVSFLIWANHFRALLARSLPFGFFPLSPPDHKVHLRVLLVVPVMSIHPFPFFEKGFPALTLVDGVRLSRP